MCKKYLNLNVAHLLPFTKLTDNSLSQKQCTERENETFIEVLNSYKASGDGGKNYQMFKGVSKSVPKSICKLINRTFVFS